MLCVMAQLEGWDYLSTLEPNQFQHEPKMPHVEPQDWFLFAGLWSCFDPFIAYDAQMSLF